jgi:DNA-directed RNA polymerase II subunit RPB2
VYINKKVQLDLVKNIEEIPTEPVMDFTTTSNNHSFIANGFITHNCGLIKNLAQSVHISVFFDPKYIIDVIKSENDTTPYQKYKIFVNGSWIKEGDVFNIYNKLKSYKINGIIAFDTSISINIKNKEMKIFTDAGRLCRPLLLVENNKLLISSETIEKIKNKTISKWEELLSEHIIEYLDPSEEENTMISNSTDKMNYQLILEKQNKPYINYAHCD